MQSRGRLEQRSTAARSSAVACERGEERRWEGEIGKDFGPVLTRRVNGQ
jgi:hypothetical protein